MTATLNPVLRSFWEAPARNRVLYGGRASSKSWDAAGFAVFLSQMCTIRVLCARQFQNKIEESVYTLLKKQIERFGLSDQYTITNNKIIHNKTKSEFLFYGLWRNIDEVKSLEDIDILWIEEAHNLTKDQWEVLEPTFRKEGSQIWIIFNPRLSSDFTYQRFVVSPPPNTIVRKINYDENEFLSGTMRQIIDAGKAENYEEFEHIYLGVPRTDDDRVIIKRSWIEAAIDAHEALGIEITGRHRVGFDVADDGADKNALVMSHGILTTGCEEWRAWEDELLVSCTRAYNAALHTGAKISYDSIGVGAAVGSKLNELNSANGTKIEHKGFNAGGGVSWPDAFYQADRKNKDFFLNAKAQAWWAIADRFRNTYAAVRNGESFPQEKLISISSKCENLERLITELSTPNRDFDASGKVKVESKKDLAKRGVSSPNLADAFIMANYEDYEQKSDFKPLKFAKRF